MNPGGPFGAPPGGVTPGLPQVTPGLTPALPPTAVFGDALGAVGGDLGVEPGLDQLPAGDAFNPAQASAAISDLSPEEENAQKIMAKITAALPGGREGRTASRARRAASRGSRVARHITRRA